MYRAQRVGEKTDLICLIMFTPGHVVTQLSKRAQFLYFPLLFVDAVGFFKYFHSQKAI